MRKTVTVALAAASLAFPAANAAAALRETSATTATAAKKRVVVKTVRVTGSEGFAGRWGNVEVTLVVKRTTTIVGKRKTVKRRIVSVGVPVYPNHTDRSVFINQQALPILVQEVLRAQFDPNVDMVSGATDTSEGFEQSLQAALLAARKA